MITFLLYMLVFILGLSVGAASGYGVRVKEEEEGIKAYDNN